MTLGQLLLVSLVTLPACALDATGPDDLDTDSTEQGVTVQWTGCEVDIRLDQYGATQQVVVPVPAIDLILNGCTNGVVEAHSTSRHYLIGVDWQGTTGECASGWLSASLQHSTAGGWATDEHYLGEGVVTSQNPPSCQRPKPPYLWTLTDPVWNRVIDRATWFDGSNYNLVDSTVTFTPEP